MNKRSEPHRDSKRGGSAPRVPAVAAGAVSAAGNAPAASVAAMAAAPWLIVLLGTALRFYRLDREPLWFDEAYTLLSVQLPVHGILERLRGEGNAPLYYLVMHFWTALFGDSEYSARLPSALLGSATIPLVYWVGTRMFSRPAALLAACCAAVSPLHIHYSQEARMYPLVPPLAVIVLYAVYRLVTAPGWKANVVFALAGLAGLYTQYYFLFLLPLAGAAVWGRDRRQSMVCAISALALVAVGFAPWIPSFLDQATNSSPDWIGTFWNTRSIALAVPWSLESLGPGASYPGWATFKFASSSVMGALSLALAALILGGAAVQLYRGATRGDGDDGATDRRVALALTLGAVLLPLCLAFVVSLLRRPIYVVARYDLIAWGAYCLLAGAVLSRFNRAAMLGALALWIGVAAFTLWPYLTTDRPKRNYADMGNRIAQMLTSHARPGEGVIFTAATRTMTQYYLRKDTDRFRLASYPLGTDAHLGWIDERIFTNAPFAADQAKQFAAWFVDAGDPPSVVWVVAPKSRGTAPMLAELARRGYSEDPKRSVGFLLCLQRAPQP
jgi:mannosyltransferase